MGFRSIHPDSNTAEDPQALQSGRYSARVPIETNPLLRALREIPKSARPQFRGHQNIRVDEVHTDRGLERLLVIRQSVQAS